MNTKLNTEINTPTPRTDDAQWGTGKVTTDFARTLERELHESRNAERLARVQLGNERARLDWLGQLDSESRKWYLIMDAVNIRAAIDAAMKEGAK